MSSGRIKTRTQVARELEAKSNKAMRTLGIALVTVGLILPLCLILVAFLWARIEGYFSLGIALHGCWVGPLAIIFVVAGIMCHMAGWD